MRKSSHSKWWNMRRYQIRGAVQKTTCRKLGIFHKLNSISPFKFLHHRKFIGIFSHPSLCPPQVFGLIGCCGSSRCDAAWWGVSKEQAGSWCFWWPRSDLYFSFSAFRWNMVSCVKSYGSDHCSGRALAPTCFTGSWQEVLTCSTPGRTRFCRVSSDWAKDFMPFSRQSIERTTKL